MLSWVITIQIINSNYLAVYSINNFLLFGGGLCGLAVVDEWGIGSG